MFQVPNEWVDLASVMGGFAAAIGVVAIPVALMQMNHADTQRRLDLLETSAMNLFVSLPREQSYFANENYEDDQAFEGLHRHALNLSMIARMVAEIKALAKSRSKGRMFAHIAERVRDANQLIERSVDAGKAHLREAWEIAGDPVDGPSRARRALVWGRVIDVQNLCFVTASLLGEERKPK